MAIRNLSLGVMGPDVKAIQQGLNIRDGGVRPRLAEDGRFGQLTDLAVRAFQGNHQLKPDGIVGPLTRCSLFPLGVAMVVIHGTRRKMPGSPRPAPGTLAPPKLMSEFGFPSDSPYRTYPKAGTQQPTKLTTEFGLGPQWDAKIRQALDSYNSRHANHYHYYRVPDLPMPVPVPQIPEFTDPPSRKGFVYVADDSRTAEFGGPFDGQIEDAFVLTAYSVFRRPTHRGHQDLQLGLTVGIPVTGAGFDGAAWTFTPYVQFTVAERFGDIGNFHLLQPYAQLGVQMSALPNPKFTLTALVFPVNMTYDVVPGVLSVNLGFGGSFNLDLASRDVTGDFQTVFGLKVQWP